MKLTLTQIKAAIAALIAVGGPLENVFVGLYTDGPAPGPNVALGDLTECTFAGYARVEVTAWSAAYLDSANKVSIDGNTVHFSPSDSVTPEIAIGYFLATALTAGTLLALEAFTVSQPMQAADDGLTLVPRLQVPSTQEFGTAAVVP